VTATSPLQSVLRAVFGIGILLATLCVIAIIIWQGIAVHGAPDPTQPHTTATVAVLDIGVLVFREGLECILVRASLCWRRLRRA